MMNVDDLENTSSKENGVFNEHESAENSEVDRSMSFSHAYKPRTDAPKECSTMQTIIWAYQSLGVVYGDLATSPVNVFSSTRLTMLTEDDLLGTLSLIFWTLTILVLIKYVFIVVHVDDYGEGGTFALYSRLCRHINFQSRFTIRHTMLESDKTMAYHTPGIPLHSKTKLFIERNPKLQDFLTFIVLLGTCMVIGDGSLTPATCVLSALQGIQSKSAKVTQDHVVFMSVVLLIALFALQRCGTSKVSFLFSPIMLIWCVTNILVGIYNIFKYYPSILKAMSPVYMVKYILRNRKTMWHLLGAVFLSITGISISYRISKVKIWGNFMISVLLSNIATVGAEAMFADLGHFNKRAIQLAFTFVVYPSLVLTYAGETAYLVHHPDKIVDAYYSSLPDSVYWPMFIVSTLAAVVASQSMISASFSLVKQSLALGCFPRVHMIHTSSKNLGQVYSPEINYILMVLCVVLVIGFRGGVELANAYGAVVIWVMIITTFLTTLVMLVIWKTNILLNLAFFIPYITIEAIIMASLLNKVPQGGWVPFGISAIFLTVMLSWTYGRSKKTAYEVKQKMNVRELDQLLSSSTTYRTPGICFFFTDLVDGIPPIIRHYIQHTNSRREIMVIVTIRTLQIKTVLPDERFDIGKLGVECVYRCLVQFGYKDSLNEEGYDYGASIAAKLLEHAGSDHEKQRIGVASEKGIIYVIGRTILRSSKKDGVLKRITINYLYRFLQKNSIAAFSALEFPTEKTLQVGMIYDI